MKEKLSSRLQPTSPKSAPLAPETRRSSEDFYAIISKAFSQQKQNGNQFLLDLIRQKDASPAGKCAALRFFLLHYEGDLHSKEIFKPLTEQLVSFYSKQASKLQAQDAGLTLLNTQVEIWTKGFIEDILLKQREVLWRIGHNIPAENEILKKTLKEIMQKHQAVQESLKEHSLNIEENIKEINELNKKTISFYKENSSLMSASSIVMPKKQIAIETLVDELQNSVKQVKQLESLHTAIHKLPSKSVKEPVLSPRSKDNKAAPFSPGTERQNSFSDSKDAGLLGKGRSSLSEGRTPDDKGQGSKGKLAEQRAPVSQDESAAAPLRTGSSPQLKDQDQNLYGESPDTHTHPALLQARGSDSRERPAATSVPSQSDNQGRGSHSDPPSVRQSVSSTAQTVHSSEQPQQSRIGKVTNIIGSALRAVALFFFNPSRLGETTATKWLWRLANIAVWIGIGIAFPPLLATMGVKLPIFFSAQTASQAVGLTVEQISWAALMGVGAGVEQMGVEVYNKYHVTSVMFPAGPRESIGDKEEVLPEESTHTKGGLYVTLPAQSAVSAPSSVLPTSGNSSFSHLLGRGSPVQAGNQGSLPTDTHQPPAPASDSHGNKSMGYGTFTE